MLLDITFEFGAWAISQGADVNAFRRGRTPINRACKFENLVLAKLLLEKGANIDAVDDCGNTSLHWAAKSSDSGVTEFLLDNGANVNARNDFGETPLHDAIQRVTLKLYNCF